MIIKTGDELKALASDSTCSVFLFASPAALPLSFAIHSWFVVIKDGIISRWEVLHKKNLSKTSWEYLHKDFLSPLKGMRVFSFLGGFHWGSWLLAHIEGEAAEKIAAVLEKSPTTYPYVSRYALPGPNSNTFAEWVLRNTGSNVQLPWNAFGKNF